MLNTRELDTLIGNFIQATDGLAMEGIASLEVAEGQYELHMKPYHVGELGGINIFNAYELSLYFYKWLTPEKVSDMMGLREFPLNLRTLYRDSEGATVLTDTHMFRYELLNKEDMEDIVEFDVIQLEEFL